MSSPALSRCTVSVCEGADEVTLCPESLDTVPRLELDDAEQWLGPQTSLLSPKLCVPSMAWEGRVRAVPSRNLGDKRSSFFMERLPRFLPSS